jgi:hypothetical protein
MGARNWCSSHEECIVLNKVIQILQDTSAIFKEKELSMQTMENKSDSDCGVLAILARYPPKIWKTQWCHHLRAI